MIEIVPYEAWHATNILERGLNNGAPESTYSFGHVVNDMGVDGQSFTGIQDGVVIACGGVLPMWPGVGEGWVLASGEIHNNKFATVRICRSILQKIMDDYGYWRIQGATLANWESGVKFARMLGFVNEGLMKRFGPGGEDYLRHARVIDGN